MHAYKNFPEMEGLIPAIFYRKKTVVKGCLYLPEDGKDFKDNSIFGVLR